MCHHTEFEHVEHNEMWHDYKISVNKNKYVYMCNNDSITYICKKMCFYGNKHFVLFCSVLYVLMFQNILHVWAK